MIHRGSFRRDGGVAATASSGSRRRKKAVRTLSAAPPHSGATQIQLGAVTAVSKNDLSDLAFLFRDLEVAVSGLELLRELREGGRAAAANVVVGESCVRSNETRVESQDQGLGVAEAAYRLQPRDCNQNVVEVADQLARWRDLCDEALKIN